MKSARASGGIQPCNCNGCGRFMVQMGAGGLRRWYHCEHCNRDTVVDLPPPPSASAEPITDDVGAVLGWLD